MNRKRETMINLRREEALDRRFARAVEPVVPMTDADRKEAMAQMPRVLTGETQKDGITNQVNRTHSLGK